MSEILRVERLQAGVGEQLILNDVSFTLKAGETLGIIGPNGSGKTTLFNCLSGFMPVSSGKIEFRQGEITHSAAHLRARKGLARVFQNFGIFRDCTLRENMLIALESSTPLWRSVFPWGSTLKKNIDASEIFLKQIGLEAQADKKASSLSGGQMRLLEIARALAFGAELLLLDEPTAGVSPKMKGQVAELLKKVQASGKSIVVIEHDINFIQSFCSRILVLDGGKVVLDDTPEIVKASPLLAEIYFGSGPIHQ